ncbi:MAG: hypothetical protein WCK02_13190 [Bacteroidota bacterium]
MRVFLFILAFVSLSFTSFAQRSYVDSIKRANRRELSYLCIKTNPNAILAGIILPYTSEYRLILETKTGKKQALQIGLSYLSKNLLMMYFENQSNTTNQNSTQAQSQPTWHVLGFRFQTSYRFYFSNDYLTKSSFYIAPQYSYGYCKVYESRFSLSTNFVEICYQNYNLLIGHQHYLSKRMCFDWFVGMGYKDNYMNEFYGGRRYPVANLNPIIFDTHLKISAGFNLGFFL